MSSFLASLSVETWTTFTHLWLITWAGQTQTSKRVWKTSIVKIFLLNSKGQLVLGFLRKRSTITLFVQKWSLLDERISGYSENWRPAEIRHRSGCQFEKGRGDFACNQHWTHALCLWLGSAWKEINQKNLFNHIVCACVSNCEVDQSSGQWRCYVRGALGGTIGSAHGGGTVGGWEGGRVGGIWGFFRGSPEIAWQLFARNIFTILFYFGQFGVDKTLSWANLAEKTCSKSALLT